MWIHLNTDDETAVSWLGERSGFDPVMQDALLEQGTRPRSLVSETGTLIIWL